MNTSFGYRFGQFLRTAQDNTIEGTRYLGKGSAFWAHKLVNDLAAGYRADPKQRVVRPGLDPSPEAQLERGLTIVVHAG